MHYRKLYPPGEFLGPQDFETPREVTISRVALAEMPERDGVKERAACLWIIDAKGNEYPRRLKLPKTVLFAFSIILGSDVDQWPGKKLTLKATWCLSFGEVEECVRPVLDAAMTKKVLDRLKKRKINSLNEIAISKVTNSKRILITFKNKSILPSTFAIKRGTLS